MNGPRLTVTADLAALGAAAADDVLARAASAIASRGRFAIALSGGSTPQPLYERLAASPWRDRTDWSRWHVFWSDERLVPADDPCSNQRLAQQALLGHVPIPAAQIHRVPIDAGPPEVVAAAYEGELRASFLLDDGSLPRFDLILLGLGSDGHTASLFPGAPALDERRRLVVATPPGSLPPAVDRVTFTLPVLNAARAIVFLVSGADKAEALRRVLAGDQSLPAARVQPTDGELHWLVDQAARGR